MGMGLVGPAIAAGVGQGLEKASGSIVHAMLGKKQLEERKRHYTQMEKMAAQRNKFLKGLAITKDPDVPDEYNSYLDGDVPATPSALPQQGSPMPQGESPTNTLAQGVSAMDLGQAYG